MMPPGPGVARANDSLAQINPKFSFCGHFILKTQFLFKMQIGGGNKKFGKFRQKQSDRPLLLLPNLNKKLNRQNLMAALFFTSKVLISAGAIAALLSMFRGDHQFN